MRGIGLQDGAGVALERRGKVVDGEGAGATTGLSETEFLDELRSRGAVRLERIRFRRNRRTIWSLTGRGTVLNLHSAYRAAPRPVVDTFAVIAQQATRRTRAFREAARAVREWEGLHAELRRIRRAHAARASPPRPAPRKGPCCATEAQLAYLEALYAHLNRTRFGDRLPAGLPLRLSARMRSRMGHMVAGWDRGERTVIELALNVDLMLEGNGRDRVETLAHEMAHAAHWLFEGGWGHGPGWRRWARIAGCEARACTRRRIRRRGTGVRRVTRVPEFPG